METLTRLVAESLARHGFDRPVDYRRLRWSHWFRCECHHSLLVVPSKPGVFALAEEVMDLGYPRTERVATQQTQAQAHVQDNAQENLGERRFNVAPDAQKSAALAPEEQLERGEPKSESRNRMLAVAHFFEDDDMAFVLDRMLSHENPMRTRLASGRYFVRFVVIEDPFERRSVCNALNQWIVSSAEKATGIGSHFATSLELTPEPPSVGQNHAFGDSDSSRMQNSRNEGRVTTAHRLNSAMATTIHCSSSFPSGF